MAVNVNVGGRSIFDDLMAYNTWRDQNKNRKALGASQLPEGYEQFQAAVGNPALMQEIMTTAMGQIGPNQRNTAYLGAMQGEGEANRALSREEGQADRDFRSQEGSLTRAFQEAIARLQDATQRYGIDQNFDLGLRELNVQDRNAGLDRMSRERIAGQADQTQRYGIDAGFKTAANDRAEGRRRFDLTRTDNQNLGQVYNEILALFSGPQLPEGVPYDPNLGQLSFSTFVEPSAIGPQGLTSPYGAVQGREAEAAQRAEMAKGLQEATQAVMGGDEQGGIDGALASPNGVNMVSLPGILSGLRGVGAMPARIMAEQSDFWGNLLGGFGEGKYDFSQDTQFGSWLRGLAEGIDPAAQDQWRAPLKPSPQPQQQPPDAAGLSPELAEALRLYLESLQTFSRG